MFQQRQMTQSFTTGPPRLLVIASITHKKQNQGKRGDSSQNCTVWEEMNIQDNTPPIRLIPDA